MTTRATSNESLSSGTNLSSSLKSFFPLLSSTEDLTEFNAVYPLSAFDNATQQTRVGTGESELRCAVSLRAVLLAVTCSNRDDRNPQAEIMGDAWSTHTDTYVYRYNTPNPEDASGLVEHAAEIWMMFKGVVTG